MINIIIVIMKNEVFFLLVLRAVPFLEWNGEAGEEGGPHPHRYTPFLLSSRVSAVGCTFYLRKPYQKHT